VKQLKAAHHLPGSESFASRFPFALDAVGAGRKRRRFSSAATRQLASSLSVGEKFDYRVVQSFGLRSMIGSAAGAAIGQGLNDPEEWGQGAAGLARRFGSGVGANLARQSVAFALESALHEDPRYFPSEERGKKRRLLNALKQTFVCRTDDGRTQFAWGRVASDFAAGQIQNAWQPASSRSLGRGIERGLISLGADAGFNVAQEFLPFLRSKTVPKP